MRIFKRARLAAMDRLSGSLTQTPLTFLLPKIHNLLKSTACYYGGYLVSDSGFLYSSGMNSEYQLGFGDTSSYRYTFAKVEALGGGVAHVSANTDFTLATKLDGSLWGVGIAENYSGLTGVDNLILHNFTQLISSGVFKTAQCKDPGGPTLVLMLDGTLWTAGSNGTGQTGIGLTSGNTTVLTRVMPEFTDIVDVVAGANSVFAIRENGDLYAWGHGGTNGQLGIGAFANTATPTKVLSNVACVSANENFTQAVTKAGELYGTGLNSHNELGNGNTTRVNLFTRNTLVSGVVDVHTTYQGSAMLKSDGTLWAVGWDAQNLGLGGSKALFTQLASGVIALGGYRQGIFYRTQDNKCYGVGTNANGALGVNTSGATPASPVVSLGSLL